MAAALETLGSFLHYGEPEELTMLETSIAEERTVFAFQFAWHNVHRDSFTSLQLKSHVAPPGTAVFLENMLLIQNGNTAIGRRTSNPQYSFFLPENALHNAQWLQSSVPQCPE